MITHTAGGTRYDRHGDIPLPSLELWETIDHRFILRTTQDGVCPPSCPLSFDFYSNAVRWAQRAGYTVINPHPAR